MTRRLMGVLRGSRIVFVMLTLGALVAACGHEPSAPSTRDIQPSFAKTAATSISVGSTSPDSATQDTTLDVVVNGSGFVAGSTATWQLSGTSDPTQVRTNSTRYVNSRQVIANITISSSATVAKWDVAVYAGTKGGVGTEMFAIKVKPNADTNSRANFLVANQMNVSDPGTTPNVQPTGVRGDDRLKDGSPANGGDSEYQGKFCGANGVIFNGPTLNGSSNSGDLNFAPDGLNGGYCGSPRYYKFYFGGASSAPVNANAAARLYGIWSMAVGDTSFKSAQFHVHLPNCTDLVYDDAVSPSRSLRVTRLANLPGPIAQWRIESQGSHMATCMIQKSLKQYVAGSSYFMPLSMVITQVPYPAPAYP